MVQGRDHAPDDLHIFCPNFYWQVLKNTFGDTEVYPSTLLSPALAQASLEAKASQEWLKPYRWGVNQSATIPISYVLLKKKKRFAVARPIISYSNFIFGRLFRAASTVLNILLPAVYPSSFRLQTLPEILEELRAFYAMLLSTFIYIYATRIWWAFPQACPLSRSWNLSTTWLHSMLPSRMQRFTRDFFRCSVSSNRAQASDKIQTGVIWLKDLCHLCELYLHTSLFSRMKRVFKQQRGSAIGNQISP